MVKRGVEGQPLLALLDRSVIGSKRQDHPTINGCGQSPGTFVPPPGRDIRTRLAPDPKIVIGDRIAQCDGRGTYPSGPAQTQWVSGAVDERITDETNSDVCHVHGFLRSALTRIRYPKENDKGI
jgi:hypothetical protein